MKKGFTLIEILITLGIVGVIAALTLPNMIKNHQKRVLVTQLQRTYNAITNAIPAYMDEVHATKLYDTDAFNYNRYPSDTSKLEEFFQNQFKTSKICTNNTNGGQQACYGREYKTLHGNVQNGFGGEVCAILKTGATICISRQDDPDWYSYIYIDVNGPQGPNVWGRDAFDLEFNNAGDIAESFDPGLSNGSGTHYHSSVNCGQNEWSYATGCFNKIIEDGWKMDY